MAVTLPRGNEDAGTRKIRLCLKKYAFPRSRVTAIKLRNKSILNKMLHCRLG